MYYKIFENNQESFDFLLEKNNDLQNQINDIARNYHTPYIGEKIDINEHKLKFSDYMTVQSSSNNHILQASAAHNDTLFQFYDAGYCVTYDLINKTKIQEFATAAQIATNHCGGACFSDRFFEDNVNYPALYISGDLTNLCCYVISINENDSVLKQKLDFSKLSTHKKASGSQVVLDLIRNKIIYQQRIKSSIGDLTNELYVCEFSIPALTDGTLIDGVLVVDMDDSKVEKAYSLPFYPGVYQAAIIINGQLLQVHGQQLNAYGMKDSVISYDINSEPHSVKSIINIGAYYDNEPEGIFIYNENLYVTYVDGKIIQINL